MVSPDRRRQNRVLAWQLAGFDGDLAPIAEIDGLIVNVHFASSSTCVRAGKPQKPKAVNLQPPSENVLRINDASRAL